MKAAFRTSWVVVSSCCFLAVPERGIGNLVFASLTSPAFAGEWNVPLYLLVQVCRSDSAISMLVIPTAFYLTAPRNPSVAPSLLQAKIAPVPPCRHELIMKINFLPLESGGKDELPAASIWQGRSGYGSTEYPRLWGS